MATRVWESSIIRAPVSAVWQVVRPLDFTYLPNVVEVKLSEDAKLAQVGGVRTVTYKDGTKQTIKLNELSDDRLALSYDLIASEPAVDVLSASYSIQLRRVTDTNETFVEITTDFSKDASLEVTEDARYKQREHMAALAEALQTSHTSVGSYPYSGLYPAPKRHEHVDDYHGTKVSDPYRWLEDPDSAETTAWVREQNNVTNKFLDTCDTRGSIKGRLTELFNFERYSCPFKRGERYFYFKNDGLQNQSVLYKQSSLEAPSELLLDPNVLEADGTASLGAYAFSEDGSRLAYGVSKSGSDWQSIYVKNVDDLTDLPDKIDWVKFSGISWTHDHKGFFYSRYPTPSSLESKATDEQKRGTETDAAANQAIYYHLIGQDQSQDVKVFSTPENPAWMMTGEVSDDGHFLLITINDSCDPVNRLFYMPLTNQSLPVESERKVIKLVDNFEALYEYITNEGSEFYFKSNLDAPRYRVIAIDINKPERGNWREVIPHHEQDVLNAVVCVDANKLITCYMHHVKELIKMYNLEGKEEKAEFPFPSVGSIGGLSARKKDSEFFYKFTSFLYPGTIFHYDIKQDKQITFRETDVKGFDADQFVAEQVFYPSKDGTKVPMFIVSKKDLPRDGNNPVLLYGYGGFNISLTPSFAVSRVVFAQHFNGIVAIPNIRGGGEYGEAWHKQGTLGQKQNVFDDFQSAAQFLIHERYTSPHKIAIHGGSNGGLLVAACLNQRPDLFGAGVAAVGVLDMLRFHKFTIGYAWCSDYGCADKKEDFEYLYKYSPLHNINTAQPYPAVLLTTADHDDRVVPLHSFKYMAELQHQVGNKPEQKAPLLIRVEVKAGHGAGKPLSKQIEETSDVFGFIAKNLDIKWTN